MTNGEINLDGEREERKEAPVAQEPGLASAFNLIRAALNYKLEEHGRPGLLF